MQQLITGEAVALDLRPAGIPSRVLAGVLDGLIQLALFFGIAVLMTAVSPSVSDAASSAMGIVLLVVVGIGYPVAFEALRRGRTPGKWALGLRVVRDDGGPIGFRQAFVRGLAGAFLERFGVTLFVGAIVTMALNSRSKRIGDLLAGTVVLQERVSVRGGQVAQMPPQLAGWAAGLDLSGVSDELALSARQFLSRAGDLTADAREELGGRLVQSLLGVLTPAPPAGTPGWAVLSAVLAERRRREEVRLRAGAQPVPGGSPSPAPTGWSAQPLVTASYAAAMPPVPVEAAPDPVDTTPTPGPGGFVAPS